MGTATTRRALTLTYIGVTILVLVSACGRSVAPEDTVADITTTTASSVDDATALDGSTAAVPTSETAETEIAEYDSDAVSDETQASNGAEASPATSPTTTVSAAATPPPAVDISAAEEALDRVDELVAALNSDLSALQGDLSADADATADAGSP